MSGSELKNKAHSGFLWSGIEKFFSFFVQFTIGIILARLLEPSDFGLIGMVSILISLSQTFTESGMGTGLIQKEKVETIDYSTVWIFSTTTSLLFYIGIYLAAPMIADFYEDDSLVFIIRVLSLVVISNSFFIVQRARLVRHMNFKVLARINLISLVMSGLTAIGFAYYGWGVWSLVVQALMRSFVGVISYNVLGKWRPDVMFSVNSFHELFRFGSRILVSSFMAQLFGNLYNVIIGKVYTPVDLGIYDRARSYSEIFSGLISNIIHEVTLPLLSSIKGDKDQLINVYRRLLRMTGFIIFPTMSLLSILAEPLVHVLLTDKWILVIPVLQLLSYSRMFYPITGVNMNMINALGRSDLYLKVNMVKFVLSGLALLVTYRYGVEIMASGQILTAIIAFFINAYFPAQLTGYRVTDQLKDLFPMIAISLVMSLAVYACISLIDSYHGKLIIGVGIGCISYYSLSRIFSSNELDELRSFSNRLLARIRN